MTHHLRASAPGGAPVRITPASAGWRYLSFAVERLAPGALLRPDTTGAEVAVVPLSGALEAVVGAQHFALARRGVFAELPRVLYLAPGADAELRAGPEGAELAYGGAPAEGRYPTRLFEPGEMRVEVRGGGAARREVHHVLAPPLPAERLILYEVYVPGGMWSGIPPHCHDGRHGSAVLEEVYHYRFDRPAGFALHRNYTREGDLDERFAVADGDTVLVTRGFHPVAVVPGANAYFLNYLAGEPLDAERATPPVDDPDFAVLKGAWEAGSWSLPLPFDR
jgi:5-deoxy-glucuronate isomerase